MALIGFFLLCDALILVLVAVYIHKKKINIWIFYYLKGLTQFVSVKNKPIDILFLFVDHFELNGHQDRLEAWTIRYPKLVARHKDSDGQCPKHSFFYAMDLMQEKELDQLMPLVEQGLGELELHWHHDHDTAESLFSKITHAMDTFHQYGYMKPYIDSYAASFGFIHGNWSLANSRGSKFCGVDNEIELLKQLGCYADFTFPALFSSAQPRQVNQIYYCSTNWQQGYSTGRQASVGTAQGKNEFMIFQGPLTINWRDWRHKWHPTIEDGDINSNQTQGDPKRIDAWVRQAIHVAGRPEWQFVKVFCHGGQDHLSVVGPETDKMFSYLEQQYNDGTKYRLHYVSAREAYNIVKAAEAGKTGNPNLYRDYAIPHSLIKNTKG